ncbi:UBP-type zinc finger domain-containing protein [Pseudonocardia sp. KRD-182]|uniref:UBP-type zinc finger domain-containing protein n=1 Tax=Pseudonocardia oceani TaxID=2792013 RepID=UPI001C4A12D6|nr:UBP-type zinc finger domain-containing protein [Pseudonocardia oceani]MBW0108589.1 UBP-type zinc finger domain-containing protein [Pseudonocardia oceani]
MRAGYPAGPDPHIAFVREDVTPRTPGVCEACLRTRSRWVHLRLCLTCGQVGCCDSSPNRHARRHAALVGHPIVRSAEPGEHWRWCYVDESFA